MIAGHSDIIQILSTLLLRGDRVVVHVFDLGVFGGPEGMGVTIFIDHRLDYKFGLSFIWLAVA